MQEQHYLKSLFEPRSVAVIGASERDGSIGAVIIKNMVESGFQGKLFAVNPKHDQVQGVPCFASVEDIPQRLDLAVIATQAPTVPNIMEACGRAGVKAAVVISAGFPRRARAARCWSGP